MVLYLSMIYDYIGNKGYKISDFHGENVSFETFRIGKQYMEEPRILSVFAQSDNSILFYCTQSCFTVNDIELEDACALTVDACQYYDHWEKELISCIWSAPDYQELIDISEKIFQNPILITNWQGKLLGYTKTYGDSPIRDFWTQLIKDGTLPFSCLSNLRKSPYYNILGYENHVSLLNFEDFDYCCILGLVHANHEIVLHFQIIEYNNPLTDTDLKLAQVFLATLRKVHRENAPVYQESASYLFSQLLNGEIVEQRQLNWILSSLGWDTTNVNYYLVYFESLDELGNEQFLLTQIERHVPGCKMLYWKEHIIMLLSEAALKKFEKDILLVNQEFDMRCGVSLPFQDWNHLSVYFTQAKSVLNYTSTDNNIHYIIDYSWQYLVNTLKGNADSMKFMHPALQTLRTYDKANNTEFAKTLYYYLRYERNVTLTAEKLFIHRNTLQYRIHKILELTNTDLNNSDVRSHLMLSYLMVE